MTVRDKNYSEGISREDALLVSESPRTVRIDSRSESFWNISERVRGQVEFQLNRIFENI